MIVVYTTFTVEADDAAGFDAWMSSIMERTRGEEGCVVYDYLKDPFSPARGAIVAVWQTAENLETHRNGAARMEVLTEGARVWKIGDLKGHMWSEAGGHSCRSRKRIDLF